jgi:hypothetical protein
VLPATVELDELDEVLPATVELDDSLLDELLFDDELDELDEELDIVESELDDDELSAFDVLDDELDELDDELDELLLFAAMPPISRHAAAPAACDWQTNRLLSVLLYQSAPARNGRPNPAVSAESLLTVGFVVE